MNVCRLIGLLLAVFVIVGLVAAPLVTPAAAKRLATAEMADMTAMSGDMPCCPDGCQDCPLTAMCMLTIAQAEASQVNGMQISFHAHRLFFVLDDLIADGLIGSPPDHPPRILT